MSEDILPSAGPPQTGDSVELLRRIRAGDQQAEGELVERFSHGLLLMLRRLARHPALAEDLHQETFRVVLEKARAGEIREPEKLPGFLRGTARNLLLLEGRRGARLRLAGDPAALAETGRGSVSDEAPQLRRILRREEANLVRQLLAELRFERDRQILVHFYLAERTKHEICADLGVDAKGFKKVLFRARERLRELWERAEKKRRLAEDVV